MNTINRRQFLAGAGATGAGLAATAIPTAAQAGSGNGQATRIIRNARVYVGDRANTIAEAIAVGADGTILGVGSYRSLKRYVGYSTEVINGHGGTVISGIQDGHAHPMYAGLASLNPTMEDAVLSAADVQSLVATFLADPQYGSEPDSWLTVEAWNPAGTPDDTLPNKDILDSLATSRPIVLNGSDGHNIWVNSKALQIAGIAQMLEDGRDCSDIVTQFSAASRALSRAGFKVVASGLRQCVTAEDAGEPSDLSREDLERLFLSLA